MENDQWRNLSFSQRYGYEQLPGPMQLEHLSEDLRRAIWNTVFRELGAEYYASVSDRKELARILGTLLKKVEDEVIANGGMLDEVKKIIMVQNFNATLDLVEMLLGSRLTSQDFPRQITALLGKYKAAYWLDKVGAVYLFSPQASKEQGEATCKAIEILNDSNMSGAVTHLREAAKHINAGQYADSIVDSIHAVESVACKIDSKKKSLRGALTSLEAKGLQFNKTFISALIELYKYTNHEQGLRHALVEQDAPNVGVDEAVFMYGACASFSAYLVNKYQALQQAGGI